MKHEAWVILIVGLPGTGKSSLANKLADVLQFTVITTETIRAQLFGETLVREDKDFTHDELASTYHMVGHMVDNLLADGKSVIIDGVFRSHAQRKSILNIAKKHEIPTLGIQTTCADALAIERLRARKKAGTLSPAGEMTYLKLKDEFEPVETDFVRIHTDPPHEEEYYLSRIFDQCRV